ncbi:SprT family zinc-dependent metalloprotease [uncultured Methanobrevibacter sp.]|uniref:M48 family metallopeptidase n=1 Tax=uncultured Methanobrevibacter sp. TaxID=253161 RepID=UPI0026017CE8
MVEREYIEIDGIPVLLEKKNNKYMYMRILDNSTLRITVPYGVSRETVEEFVRSRKEWILEKMEYLKNNPPKPKLKYLNDEIHYIWGQPYKIQLITNNFIKNAFYDADEEIIYLPVSKRSTIQQREKTMRELYRREVQENLDLFLENAISIVGQRPSEIKIRSMKNWGNCNTNRRVTLNLNLAKKPPECLKYVLIHELTHLIEFNHGPRFKELMDQFCPNWRELKEILNSEQN